MDSYMAFAPRRFAAAALTAILGAILVGASAAWAANATTLDTDPNIDGLEFGGNDAFVFGGAYSQDDTASFNGNDILVQTQAGAGGGAGAGFSIPVSNGENGLTQSLDGAANEVTNPDADNTTPANSVFAAIGNASGKLANGNVIRFSGWVRVDPNNPITVAPQIEPVFKFEFWKEALSTNQDTGGGQAQPFFGDKVYDTDQHLSKGVWIDLDNNGSAADGSAAGDGRLKTVSTTAWTLIEASYVVDDSQWIGIGDDPYTVAQIEEVRSVMFWGDFAGTDFSPDGPDGGSLWFDNLLVEVFKDEASVTPNANPNPDLGGGGEPGDFDNNGVVNGADLTIWKTAFGTTAAGDADDDDDTDGADFLIWQQNIAAEGVSAVPEPSSVGLLIGGAAALGAAAARKRR